MKIARHWTGLCQPEREADYMRHLTNDTFVKLKAIEGFIRASILKREINDGVEFLIVTEWENIAAIRKFAGDDYEIAVVPAVDQEMMIRYDQTVKHYEIVSITTS